MQFVLAEAAQSKESKLSPRHFIRLCEGFSPEHAAFHTNAARPGQVLTIRAPGAYSLGHRAAKARPGTPNVFDALTSNERRLLQNHRSPLLIDLGWESFFVSDLIVESLVEQLGSMDIDPSQVVIVHSNLAAEPALSHRWRAHANGSRVRTLPFPVSLALGLTHQLKERCDETLLSRFEAAKAATLRGGKRKAYNFFNGEARIHRVFLLAWLHSQGLLERGYVSMLAHNKGNKKGVGSIEWLTAKFANMTDDPRIFEALPQVLAMLPMVLDMSSEHVVANLEAVAWTSQDPAYYDESCFSVVSETSFFDDDVLMLTEKLMKPWLNGSPLVCFGNRNVLANIKRWGFMTCSPVFGEGYDDVADHTQRMRLGLAELERLCAMPQAELEDCTRSLWSRSEYNYWHFWNGFPTLMKLSWQDDVLHAIEKALTA